MGEQQAVAIAAIAACLVLVLANLRSFNLEAKRALFIGGIWAGIFAVVILVFSIMRSS